MSSSRLAAIAILLGLALAGCGQKPPQAPPSLPRVERPVLALDVKPGATLRIKIPRAALAERGGIPGVFVLNEADEARFRLVRPGRTSGTQVEILSGLHGNETLVLGDLGAVHDGTPIKIK
jgi:multidrug efflux pump subunit AcrA (membrane-fusion protein)